MFASAPLPPPDAQDGALILPHLPNLTSSFFMPKMQDKPQNPIIDGLRFTSASFPAKPSTLGRVPPVKPLTSVEPHKSSSSSFPLEGPLLFAEEQRPQHSVQSWDALLSSNKTTEDSPFLSEHESHVFVSVRYQTMPRVFDAESQTVHTTSHKMLDSLALTVLGTSSALHHWDDVAETFVLAKRTDEKNVTLVVAGKDGALTESLLDRLLTIGTVIRRLETFCRDTIQRESDNKPTHHAFVHALSSVLARTRRLLDGLQRTALADHLKNERLASIWLAYAPHEELMLALGSLCARDMSLTPSEYKSLPSTSSKLLSHIYTHLSVQVDTAASSMVIGTLACLLTTTSRSYFKDICTSIGYVSDPGAAAKGDDLSATAAEGDVMGEQNDFFLDDLGTLEAIPIFVPPVLASALPRAKRSLELLRKAAPNHPLLRSQAHHVPITWFWTDSEVADAWTDDPDESQDLHALSIEATPELPPTHAYKPELAQFRIFDLEPTLGLFVATPPTANQEREVTVDQFLDSFPEALPSLTPTLPDLTFLIFEPLLRHAERLSDTLVSVFLDRSSQLDLQSHLLFLRSHMLFTAHSFKTRLAEALFSDADEPNAAASDSTFSGHARKLSRSSAVSDYSTSSTPWPVGLATGLTNNNAWPPTQSDLGFSLRTVLVDSLPDSAREVEVPPDDPIWRDAEDNLGFAMRDLPTSGKARWLNPLALEALDLLYMDYKPPGPLRVLIPPELISKYQRMSTFILRIMRVENASRSIFRMSRDPHAPLFPTLARSSSLFQHFRSVAHAFVTALSSYVFDTAIRVHFDGFLAELAAAASMAAGDQTPDTSFTSSASAAGHATSSGRSARTSPLAAPRFPDVFALARRHSDALDAMLSACLLRSGQKLAGDAIHACLEAVLAFAIFTGEMRTGRVPEYRAAITLDDQWDAFRRRMAVLVKIIKVLVDKGSAGSRYDDLARSRGSGPVVTERDSLRDLLTRLDFNEWWQKASSNKCTRAH